MDPNLTVEFVDMTGNGWSRIASAFTAYLFGQRRLNGIRIDHSGVRAEAFARFLSGAGELKPPELIYVIKHVMRLCDNEEIAAAEHFDPQERESADFLLAQETLRQYQLIAASNGAEFNFPEFPAKIRSMARKSVQLFQQREISRQEQFLARLAREYDAASLADMIRPVQGRQTAAMPGKRLILAMCASDISVILNPGRLDPPTYNTLHWRVDREGPYHLRNPALQAFLEAENRNHVVVTRLHYFLDGSDQSVRNPWEIPLEERRIYDDLFERLLVRLANGLQRACKGP
jgi:hypothetical protein